MFNIDFVKHNHLLRVYRKTSKKSSTK